MSLAAYSRVILKISGEALKGEREFGLDPATVAYVADEVAGVFSLGVQMGIVVGGGNIWRGADYEAVGMDRATADSAGMLATIINALALQDILEKMEVSELTRKFVGLIAKNRRLFALTDMIEGFLAELARRRGEISAEVTAARPLSDAQISALQETLQKSLGGKVTVAPKVDPGLIGGLVVRVGSQMIDTSLRTQLNKMQLAMKGTS